MSLVAFALRLATVQALKGKTLAESRILDAPIEPLDFVIGTEKAVVIAVYTGEEVSDVTGKDLLAADRVVELTLQIFLPDTVKVISGGEILEIDTRRSGAEATLNLMWRQIERVLLTDQGPWADLWRQIVMRIPEMESHPYLIETDTGIRIASRETTLHCETLGEPPIGEAPTAIWSDFLAAMRVDPELRLLADLVENEIVGGELLPDWRKVQAALGLTKQAVGAIGFDPSLPAPLVTPEEVTALTEILIDPGAVPVSTTR